tara:strand:- start:64 stop:645 length:582 start_codon:yes stop_codon:yes gene_type:complete
LVGGTKEYAEIISALDNIRVPICEGFKRPPFDVKQGLLNSMIDHAFVERGWNSQPWVDTSKDRKSSQKGDFSIQTECGLNILVEVEFGNVASTFRDLYKFNLAYSTESYDCGIFILPDKDLAKRVDTIQNVDGARTLIEDARDSINLPLVLIGVGFDGNEIDLLTIKNDVNYWKTYKLDDFNSVISDHSELRF